MRPQQQAFQRSIKEALRNEPAVWTPQCPEPETLLDWIEQDEAHPQSASLLEHLSACAYCRQEYVAMRETWALVRQPVLPTALASAANAARGVPGKVAAWMEQLLQGGLATPVHAAQEVLKRMDRAIASVAPVSVRSAQSASSLRPAFTAIRSLHPRLTWSPADGAEAYLVTISQHLERNNLRQIWSRNVGRGTEYSVPAQVELQPGNVYVWQVIALHGDQEHPSAPAGFAVLSEQALTDVEALEQTIADAPLALISLYEAYGLYEEALLQLTKLNNLEVDTEQSLLLQRKLHEKLHYPDV